VRVRQGREGREEVGWRLQHHSNTPAPAPSQPVTMYEVLTVCTVLYCTALSK
jgi:hypothetical protein